MTPDDEPEPNAALRSGQTQKGIRLHPLSILFRLGGELRSLAFPLVLAVFFARKTEASFIVQLSVVLVIALIGAVWRYFSFRMIYGDGELVIRTGILQRNERHIPYSRIQSVDSTRNAFHQLFGVVDVVIQTAGGSEPEAKLSVLPASAVAEIRARVFGSAHAAAIPDNAVVVTPDAAVVGEKREIVLRLASRDLFLYGFIENRGLVLVLAAAGILMEVGPFEQQIETALNAEFGGAGPLRSLAAGLFSRGGIPTGMLATAAAAVLCLMIVARFVSVLWAAVRMHDFTVYRVGNDLRVEYGLFTRVAGTIPMHRIQTVTVRSGLAHRMFKRATVSVSVARGGPVQKGGGIAEPLIPLIPESQVPQLLATLWPDLDVTDLAWQPLHPRAFIRILRGGCISAFIIAVITFPLLRLWSIALFASLCVWHLFSARRTAYRTMWAMSMQIFAVRRGWLRRSSEIAWLSKVQMVGFSETLFDRRNQMARVSAGTAGGVSDLAYISRDAALELHGRLTAEAARTEFRL